MRRLLAALTGRGAKAPPTFEKLLFREAHAAPGARRGEMFLRWIGAALLFAEKGFRKVRGYRHSTN